MQLENSSESILWRHLCPLHRVDVSFTVVFNSHIIFMGSMAYMPPPAQEGRAHTVVLVRGSRGTASHLCCLLISSFSTQPLLPLSHALSVTSLACTLLLGRKGEERGGEKEEGRGGERRKGEGRGGKRQGEEEKGGGEEGGRGGKDTWSQCQK